MEAPGDGQALGGAHPERRRGQGGHRRRPSLGGDHRGSCASHRPVPYLPIYRPLQIDALHPDTPVPEDKQPDIRGLSVHPPSTWAHRMEGPMRIFHPRDGIPAVYLVLTAEGIIVASRCSHRPVPPVSQKKIGFLYVENMLIVENFGYF